MLVNRIGYMILCCFGGWVIIDGYPFLGIAYLIVAIMAHVAMSRMRISKLW